MFLEISADSRLLANSCHGKIFSLIAWIVANKLTPIELGAKADRGE